MHLTIQPTFTLLDLKTCPHKTSIGMLIADLFVIAENWIQPRFPSVGECSNSYHGILLSNKKHEFVDKYNLDGSQRHYTE